MKNVSMIKAMIARCLVIAMTVSLVPGNVWGQTQQRPMAAHQFKTSPSNADDTIEDEDADIIDEDADIIDEDADIIDDEEIASDSDAKEIVPAANLLLSVDPV